MISKIFLIKPVTMAELHSKVVVVSLLICIEEGSICSSSGVGNGEVCLIEWLYDVAFLVTSQVDNHLAEVESIQT